VTLDFAGFEASKVRALGGSDQVTIGDLAGTALKTTTSTSPRSTARATAPRTR
jgi:hypothetical protein